uniref:T9SS sorting signal type C domain-containing protein n=1 Tax=Gelidibacter sp. TaxID=2018083 RepID=UPI00404A7BC4
MKTPLLKLIMMSIFSSSLIGLHASSLFNSCENNSSAFEIPTSIWDGDSWTPAAPTILAIAILTGDYNTGTDGSFTALSLTINEGVTLTIDNDTYVQVKTNATIDGNLIVQTKGAFVQIDAIGTFTLGTNGSSRVNKMTSQLNRWYDYTYWSSPVNGTTIAQAFASSHPSRRYLFNAENYLDEQAEIGNTGVYEPGQDDIDDDGNDWQLQSGSHVLQPGVGYATTHSSSGFVSGNSYPYNFVGSFNTGTITTPIHYNGDNGDSDWNFIGNPYPSAIDVDAFFTENAAIVGGVVYLWAHGTPASATTGGNQTNNFTSEDYAIINAGSGEVAGGTDIIPERFIPSGQGFFVQGLADGNVTFTNAMRMADATSNSQFFRQSNATDNKIWLNLSSNNGAFNQVLVAYLDGATDGDDGTYYDAKRNLSTSAAAIIYTSIADATDQKYAIQGKAASSLNLTEVIPIGFYTTIDEATIYTFSIPKKQGDFFSSNPIYLKDNLLGITHEVSASDYTFTSETGEFNSRFEIVFTLETLGLGAPDIHNQLTVVELSSGHIQFKMSGLQNITAIHLYDVLGRLVAQKQTHSSNETLEASGLSQASYIAKVTLENGHVLTKKILKRF